MQIGVIILGFEARQADQCAWIAQHGRRNIVDQRYQRYQLIGGERAPHPRLLEHRDDGGARTVADVRGACHFSFQRLRAILQFDLGCDVAQDCFVLCGSLGRRGCILHINTARGIDPEFAHRGGHQPGDIVRIVDQKAGIPERMIGPRAAELLDEHPDLELRDGDLLAHGAVLG